MIKNKLVSLAVVACTLGAGPVLASGIHVRDAWIPAYGEGARSAPLFLTVTNTGTPDRLIGARSDAAERVSINTLQAHEGELRATALQAVALPSGVPVIFESGNAWLQLEGLKAPLRPRATVTVKLVFERAGEREYRIRVRPNPLGGDTLENMRTDPLQQPGQTQRTEGLDDALRSDPFLR
ncbi:copper chaperone PCu(A)C [Pseudothauera lacus]|uniref:Copper chaperone PCu(A)C n=1 Tax=Pseudothauera lacus TaxID=2136175 RepID=A0A2T4IJ47_9RHOO|nr:copper chaperone PCu(A)C [Pseudothauera lacus]PTD97772.1 hypothetical protein C8261_03615 [Pseudothauera lacus]